MEYSKSIFINCPYGDAYSPLLRGIVLTVVACGFIPRCALETTWRGWENRADRIFKLLLECQYSIHDLSKYQGEGKDNLARLNMPFELGLAFGIERLSAKFRRRTHGWVALVLKGSIHERALSDLKGFDPLEHDETVDGVIAQTYSWLTQLPECGTAPPPDTILASYSEFAASVQAAEGKAKKAAVTWPVILRAAKKVAVHMPTPPLP